MGRILLSLLLGAAINHARGEVSWSETATEVTASNGRITAQFTKDSAQLTSLLFDGVQMVDPQGHIYFSMDGGANFEKPARCSFSVATTTPEGVDLVFRQTPATGSVHAFDMEFHFVLRQGDTGIYSYAVLAHPAAYPAAVVGEFRLVWKLPNDGANFTFERLYVDSERHGAWGSYADFQAAEKTEISEIKKLLTGVRAGRYDCKYQFAARYAEIGCWGHASDRIGKGAWVVLGGQEYLNDGPTKQDLTLAENYNLVHLNRNHFGGSSIQVAAGEGWHKVFGPFLLYCNSTEAKSGAGDFLWAEAKKRASAELAAWPPAWVRQPEFTPAAERGAVTGELTIHDPLKPRVNAAHAWVGLAAAEETAGNWQDQSRGYQFWTRADAAGKFTIPNVRAGSYTLYAFNDGAVGEFSRAAVTVSPGATTALQTLKWDVPHRGERIAWEIGTPDRTAREFRHGDIYTEPFLWKTFATGLPNPLVYTIGVSTPAKDWNYAHSGYLSGGVWSRWPWQIRFSLKALPAAGEATLTIALASANTARLSIAVNEDANPFAEIDLTAAGGNALIREGIHAKYDVQYVSIPVSRLRVGSNTITLVQTRVNGAASHVMYDYLSLELPGATSRVTAIQKAEAPEVVAIPTVENESPLVPASAER